MDANAPIYIETVGNGFVVRPGSNGAGCVATSDIRVFQTMAEMQDFIVEHFEHRNTWVRCDAPPLDEVAPNEIYIRR